MGGKNAQKQQETKSAAAEAERVKMADNLQNSPEALAYKARIASRRKAIDTGNIGGASDFIGNDANAAVFRRKAEAEWQATPTGLMGLAGKYADPREAAMNASVMKAKQGEAAAGQLENDWRGYIGETQDAERGVLTRNDNIYSSLMSNADDRSSRAEAIARQIASQRANMWSSIAGAALGGGMSMISGGMSAGGIFNKAKR